MQPQFIIEQKITPLVNRYKVYRALPDNQKGELVAYAQQKRLAFKEKVFFYADLDKTRPIFSFRAEKVLDVRGRFFVEDMNGEYLGVFRKVFRESLLNSTWHIFDKAGQERYKISESNQALAIFRRFGGQLPIVGAVVELICLFLKYHFQIVDMANGQVSGEHRKTTLLRDNYVMSLDPEASRETDWRVWVSVGIALDALQSR